MTEIPDVMVVADYLERMAPTQSHANRRNFQAAAKMLRGADISEDSVVYSIPVTYDGVYIGDASITIADTGPDAQFEVTTIAHFIRRKDWDDEKQT